MKKSLALLLSLILALGLLSGCGGKDDTPTDVPDTPPAEQTDPASASGSDPAPATEPEPEPAAAVDTMILKEADDKMINTYTLLAVNPEAPFTDADGNAVSDVAVNTAGAEALIDWLLSDEGLTMPTNYGQAD